MIRTILLSFAALLALSVSAPADDLELTKSLYDSNPERFREIMDARTIAAQTSAVDRKTIANCVRSTIGIEPQQFHDAALAACIDPKQ